MAEYLPNDLVVLILKERAADYSKKTLECVNILFKKYPLILETSGSSREGVHHFGKNGLGDHTLEVIRYCDAISALTLKANKELLFLAALFHDVGKAWDYKETEDGWEVTEHKYKIHHISRSVWIWRECAAGLFEEDFIDEVSHCILSHHGRKDWGSPVEPDSVEAHILHHCDSISAKIFEFS